MKRALDHVLMRLALVFGVVSALAGTAVAAGADDVDARPNIVFAIADDWSWPHAGAYGDTVNKTPAFDRVAAEGALFSRSFCATPSCTPSRGAILTGQVPHRLENGANLWSMLPAKFATYPDLLEAAGYDVGLTGKGWGPGTIEGSGRTRNPAGPGVPDFAQFLKGVPRGKPFCYWFGSHDPHRPYEKGTGVKAGMRPEDVKVPAFLPDTPEVRSDILDYYFEVQRFDRAVAAILEQLDAAGLAENTIVVVTSDNGMPFPRAKANLYDSGTHMPLAIRWPAKIKPGQTLDAFVSHADFAPTFLEAAGLKPEPAMTGHSLLGLLLGRETEDANARDAVFLERERHANARKGNLSYPSRAIRTAKYLYVRNLLPDRWPAGDPETFRAINPFGDIDGSPTKDLILDRRDDPAIAPYFRMACARRPAEELYDLTDDPAETRNVADQPKYARARTELRQALDRWMKSTADPRAIPGNGDDPFDHYPYVGNAGGPAAKAKTKGS